jgi:hypothetical protein
MKPYVKLASGLVMFGMSMFMLERYGLSQLSNSGMHLATWLLTGLVIAPLVLIGAGCLTFMVGRIRRL